MSWKWSGDNGSQRFGVIVTLLFHVVLLGVLCLYSLRSIKKTELSFLTDSDGDVARRIEEEELRQQEEINELAHSQLEEEFKSASVYRSIAVERGVDQSESEREGGSENSEPSEIERSNTTASDGIEVAQGGAAAVNENSGREYRGPSVLSWTLDGRRALYLPIPAYKCQGEGIVYVRIIVGRNGYVKKATILFGQSASDECLRNCALDAAKVSRFSSSETASDNQIGEIAYKFIAQ